MKAIEDIKHVVPSVLKGGDVLIVVPPIALYENPVLGVHTLQAMAREKGFKVEILYLNVLLASIVGLERSKYITFSHREMAWMMLHERLFARSAYGLPPMGRSSEHCLDEAISVSGGEAHHRMLYSQEPIDLEIFHEVECMCGAFLDEAAEAITRLNYSMVGCSVRLGQVNCTVALLERIKQLQPEAVTLVGGPNCQDRLARGMASLSSSFDYIFSGESEETFCRFLEDIAKGIRPVQKIIRGKPFENLDRIPLPDYSNFFDQIERFMDLKIGARQPGDSVMAGTLKLSVSYETNRGCWWGEKSKCRFCGNKIHYREKSSGKVLADMQTLSRSYPGTTLLLSDNIMPHFLPREVLPVLAGTREHSAISLLVKSNLDLETLMILKKANAIQVIPGIESLSTGLLKIMSKGCTAYHNVRFLRDAGSIGINLDWLLLWGFPGDEAEQYEESLELFPLIHHLQPPQALLHLHLTRFSPFFEHAGKYRITNIRPWEVYKMIYPQWADIENLGFWHTADYPCGAHENPELMEKLASEVHRWQSRWQQTHLTMVPFNDSFLIMDNREIAVSKQEVVDYSRAKEIMMPARNPGSPNIEWALERKFGVRLGTWYTPLVTAAPEILLQFEAPVEGAG